MKRLSLTIPIILLLCCYANAQTEVDQGTVQNGVYSNSTFGFSFKYPKDWAVHGEATNERLKELGKEKIAETTGASRAAVDIAANHTYSLLTVFRQPLGTPGVTFNPAVLVIAENIAHAPGITNGKDYLLNVRAILVKAGYQFLLKEPVEYRAGGSQFFRDNYAIQMNGVNMVQANFATVKNGYALVFLFIGQDQANLDEMTKTMETLDFGMRHITTISEPPPAPPKPN